jgi:quinol monooxygenase YgiN
MHQLHSAPSLEDDPDTVLIYEQYRDAKALAAHRESEHFKNHAVGGLYQKMRERSRNLRQWE